MMQSLEENNNGSVCAASLQIHDRANIGPHALNRLTAIFYGDWDAFTSALVEFEAADTPWTMLKKL